MHCCLNLSDDWDLVELRACRQVLLSARCIKDTFCRSHLLEQIPIDCVATTNRAFELIKAAYWISLIGTPTAYSTHTDTHKHLHVNDASTVAEPLPLSTTRTRPG